MCSVRRHSASCIYQGASHQGQKRGLFLFCFFCFADCALCLDAVTTVEIPARILLLRRGPGAQKPAAPHCSPPLQSGERNNVKLRCVLRRPARARALQGSGWDVFVKSSVQARLKAQVLGCFNTQCNTISFGEFSHFLLANCYQAEKI